MPNRTLLPQASQVVGLIELEPLASAAEQGSGNDATLAALFDRLAREPGSPAAEPARCPQCGERPAGQDSEQVSANFSHLERELQRAMHRWRPQRRC